MRSNDSVLFSLWLEASTLSAEKIFQCESSVFLLVFLGLFLVLYGVSGSAGWCFVVTFNVGMRDV